MYRNGFPLEARLQAAIDWLAYTRTKRPGIQDAVLESAYDGLVDVLMSRPDLGGSRKAVWALGRQQLGWKISSSIRARRLPDGRARSGPSGAVSLERLADGVLDGSIGWEPPAPDDTEMAAVRRVAIKQTL